MQQSQWFRYLAAALAGVALAALSAKAQQVNDLGVDASVPDATLAPASRLAAAAGPKIYLADRTGKLGTLELGTKAVKVVGNMGVVMTDIAFCPGGTLYAITFSRLYRVNATNATKAAVGNGFGSLELNALTCNASGQLFAHSNTQAKLYKLNRSTGKATVVGSTGSYRSDGDLALHEGGLFLTSTNNRLVKLNKASGAVVSAKTYSLNDMFGLVSTGTDKLYGFAGTNAYRLLENATGPTGGKTLLFGFSGKGLQQIYGAAYNGNFQN
jgi:hypothetical protein